MRQKAERISVSRQKGIYTWPTVPSPAQRTHRMQIVHVHVSWQRKKDCPVQNSINGHSMGAGQQFLDREIGACQRTFTTAEDAIISSAQDTRDKRDQIYMKRDRSDSSPKNAYNAMADGCQTCVTLPIRIRVSIYGIFEIF